MEIVVGEATVAGSLGELIELAAGRWSLAPVTHRVGVIDPREAGSCHQEVARRGPRSLQGGGTRDAVWHAGRNLGCPRRRLDVRGARDALSAPARCSHNTGDGPTTGCSTLCNLVSCAQRWAGPVAPASPSSTSARPATGRCSLPVRTFSRIACILATRHGIKLLAPVHDAVLIEAPIERIEADVALMREIMRRASRIVFNATADGRHELRTDVKIVRYPERYSDPRGDAIWNQVLGLLDAGRERQEAEAAP